MRSEQEIKQLAMDISDGKVFGSWNCESVQESQSSFMVLALIDQEQLDQFKTDNIVHFYEYYSEAGPVSVNGRPIFTSVRTINENEWKKLVEQFNIIKEFKKQFMG